MNDDMQMIKAGVLKNSSMNTKRPSAKGSAWEL